MWKWLSLLLLANVTSVFAQDIELYSQFNGRYDYTAIGNTLNIVENGVNDPCQINTSSQATLTLNNNQTVVAAYLYWAGTHTGDFDVELNNTPISAERTFSASLDENRVFFAAFADVTQQIITTGNGIYELSELDLTNVIAPYCPTGGNFAGWAITIIYEDDNLPLNQLNVYDGMQSVSQYVQEITINIDNMNVTDNNGAKIGFIAWEGDASLAVNETLRVNGNIISNPPLNPANNAFNGTNSFTGQSNLYNMDIDYYNIQNNIQVGDTSVEVKLTSGQDFVMVNNVITVLNSQVPDASVSIDNYTLQCEDDELLVNFSIHNFNSTEELPAGTEYDIMLNGNVVASGTTPSAIPMDGIWASNISIDLINPDISEYELEIIVDPNNLVYEILEDNNSGSIFFNFEILADISPLPDLEQCQELENHEVFDLTQQNELISSEENVEITYYTSPEDAENQENWIAEPSEYIIQGDLQQIYVRYENNFCFEIANFNIEIIACPIPDASVAIFIIENACYSNEAVLHYTIYNENSTGPLPEGTEIAFFADEFYLISINTPQEIPVGGNWEANITLNLPENLTGEVELHIVIDPGNLVEEILETNNETSAFFEKQKLANVEQFPPLLSCNEGDKIGIFNLTEHEILISEDPAMQFSYFSSLEDAMNDFNEIFNPSEYKSEPTPQHIYVRYEAADCYNIASFILEIENCPPFVPQGFSPNGDGYNDTFEISGLYDIFTSFELSIYTRLGNKIYTTNNGKPEWDGSCNTGLSSKGEVPTGTYYYVLKLNDPDYDIITGWVYLNR